MSNLIKVFIPSSEQTSEEGYLKGCYITTYNTTTIYFTKFYSESEFVLHHKNIEKSPKIIYGYCGETLPKKKFIKLPNNVILNKAKSSIIQLTLNRQAGLLNNIIIMQYDYNKIKDTQTIMDTADPDILYLKRIILEENQLPQKHEACNISFKIPYWLTSSMFLQHVSNYLNLVNWLVDSVKRNKKISIKQGNLMLAVLTDVILGYYLLHLVTNDTKYINSQLMEMLESPIKMLYSLLTWLMGAPVGLKLNKAFNEMLGKYFSYHVQLWWLFLDTCSTKLDVILNIYHYIGYLGFTFQIAVISDMICLATFHSYCIYVYAARLFNIQISGLIALLRLFVGRKYNPLRGGIDSCEYTNQELFVGTVAFTILLLLLPTTAMYYIVFTVFRLLSLAVQHILAKLIYMVQTLPLYVGTLWLTKSRKVAGNILIEVKEKESSHLVLQVKLHTKSISELIQYFKPPVEVPKQVEWTNLISNILKGKQILQQGIKYSKTTI